MATLKASANRNLRDWYHNILDDLDDDKELMFAIMQQACARQFRRHPDSERADSEHSPDTPCSDHAQQHTLPAKTDVKYLRQGAHRPESYNKYTIQGAQEGGPDAFLCNFLDDQGVKPEKVLQEAGLADADCDSPDSVHALYVASTKYWPRTIRSDSDADSDANAYAFDAVSDSDDSI
jgi:hypothetical protein